MRGGAHGRVRCVGPARRRQGIGRRANVQPVVGQHRPEMVAARVWGGASPCPAAPVTAHVLDDILTVLGGDPAVHAEKSRRRLSSDFIHLDSFTWVEFDEVQHFTSWRLLTLLVHDDDLTDCLDVAEYRQLCEEWAHRADRAWRNKPASGFAGPSGRARQHAYFDAVRDLCVPAITGETIIRVPAPAMAGDLVWARYGDRVRRANGVPG